MEHWLPGLFLPAPGKAGSVRLWIGTAQNNLRCCIPTHYLPENQGLRLLLLAEAMASDRLVALRIEAQWFPGLHTNALGQTGMPWGLGDRESIGEELRGQLGCAPGKGWVLKAVKIGGRVWTKGEDCAQ